MAFRFNWTAAAFFSEEEEEKVGKRSGLEGGREASSSSRGKEEAEAAVPTGEGEELPCSAPTSFPI